MKARVAVTREKNRYETVRKALELIKEDIYEKLKNAKKIVIKPNFVTVYNQLAATHKDAVKAVLDIITPITKRKIIIAESSAIGNTMEGFKNYGYLELEKDYDVEFVDLDEDDFEYVKIFDENFEEFEIPLSKTILKSDFRISVCPMKTHDTVIVTLSIKNIAVGSILGSNKGKIHQGYKAINLNLYKIAKFVMPHLGIIDGWVGMEGDGPVNGLPIKAKVCVASSNPIAADWVAAKIMGFDPKNIGYLFYLYNKFRMEIEVIGKSIESVKTNFKPHFTYNNQLNWKIDENLRKNLLIDND